MLRMPEPGPGGRVLVSPWGPSGDSPKSLQELPQQPLGLCFPALAPRLDPAARLAVAGRVEKRAGRRRPSRARWPDPEPSTVSTRVKQLPGIPWGELPPGPAQEHQSGAPPCRGAPQGSELCLGSGPLFPAATCLANELWFLLRW